MLKFGYAVANVEYRFSQEAIFPAQIEDCKAAVRWLRAHAAKYGYDAQRIGAWGGSAGGHLVALLATTGNVKDFDVGENLDQSSAMPSDDPAKGLRAVLALRRLAERLEAHQVAVARGHGWSWQQIGDALGMTRQSIHTKYGR